MVGRGAASVVMGERGGGVGGGVGGGAEAIDPDCSVVQGPKARLEGAGDAN